MNATYDYACALEPGNFIPPGFSAVPTCHFYAMLHYEGSTLWPKSTNGTGGGRHPRPVAGADFDLTKPEGWALTQPLVPSPVPTEPDWRITLNLGLLGPTYSDLTGAPLSQGRWYIDDATRRNQTHPPRSYQHPSTPLYMTKGLCGAAHTPIVNVPESGGF